LSQWANTELAATRSKSGALVEKLKSAAKAMPHHVCHINHAAEEGRKITGWRTLQDHTHFRRGRELKGHGTRSAGK